MRENKDNVSHMNNSQFILENRFTKEYRSQFLPQIQLAIQAVLSAALSIQSVDIASDVRTKEGMHNFVTAWDLKSEKTIIDLIKNRYPNASILSEESAAELEDPLAYEELWVIDPLDGTTNAFYDRGYSCIAVAFVKDGKPHSSAVYNPIRDELFYAERGIGAFLNAKKIELDKEVNHKLASICADTIYDPSMILFHLDLLKGAKPSWISARGSGILIMAEIAAGRYDLYFHADIKPWDNAAGFTLIEMAGGVYRGLDGREINILSTDMVVGDKGLVEEFTKKIKPILRDYKFVPKIYGGKIKNQ